MTIPVSPGTLAVAGTPTSGGGSPSQSVYGQRNYSNLTTTSTLGAGVSSTSTVLTLFGSMVLPAVPFEAAIDYTNSSLELVLVTAVAGLSWTVIRGYDGSTEVSHAMGAGVAVVTSAVDFQAMNNHTVQPSLDQHTEYLALTGARHDLTSLHQAGLNLPVAVPSGTLLFDQQPEIGPEGPYVRSDHVHQGESLSSLAQGLYYSGAMMLWSAVAPLPPGWAYCDGSDLDISDFPQTFSQIGYSFGGAVGWYPRPPLIATSSSLIAGSGPIYGAGGYALSPSGALVIAVTSSSMTALSIEAPPDASWWLKLPQTVLPGGSRANEPLESLTPAWESLSASTVIPPLRWVMAVDRGAIRTPRPTPPAPVPMYYADGSPGDYSPGSSATAGLQPSPYLWGFDGVTGIPVIYSRGGSTDNFTYPVKVFPYGTTPPAGTTVIPSS